MEQQDERMLVDGRRNEESVLQNFIHSLTVITPHRGRGQPGLQGMAYGVWRMANAYRADGRTVVGRGFEVSQP